MCDHTDQLTVLQASTVLRTGTGSRSIHFLQEKMCLALSKYLGKSATFELEIMCLESTVTHWNEHQTINKIWILVLPCHVPSNGFWFSHEKVYLQPTLKCSDLRCSHNTAALVQKAFLCIWYKYTMLVLWQYLEGGGLLAGGWLVSSSLGLDLAASLQSLAVTL